MANAEVMCDIGFIGLGVMGKNLTLNLADNGYQIACFDLDQRKIDDLLSQDQAERGAKAPRVIPCDSFSHILKQTSSPRLIILSIPAGKPVVQVCDQLIEAGIEPNDIVVDTGNSLWTDSIAREAHYRGKFIFFSTAISGGEVGARFGPSLMPSGDRQAWERIEPVWHAVAAKVDAKSGKPIETFTAGEPVLEGESCSTYIGPIGSGHYVKMVHNGIEYADMQLICEAYQIMRQALHMSPAEIAVIFRQWNKGELNSYLIEISAEVLDEIDAETGLPIVDVIMDKAGQKGTGLWTAVAALQVGSPAQTIAQAVFARSLSSLKKERVVASRILSGPTPAILSDQQKELAIDALHDALYCSKICAYAQGFQLMQMASIEQKWQLDFAEIAKIWRAGCIIRAAFLQPITSAYQQDQQLANLLLNPFFSDKINRYQDNWRQAIARATLDGIPLPAMSSALNYYDSYRAETSAASLLQGQRDFFGAHTFERVDRPEGEKYHIEWSLPGRPQAKI
jgi:6-phosphogluconate dehydrogenase